MAAPASQAEGTGQVACSFQVPCPGAQVEAGLGAQGQASSSSAPNAQLGCSVAQARPGTGAQGQASSPQSEGAPDQAPGLEVQDVSSEEDAEGCDRFDPWTSRCSGPPIRCRHSMGGPEFVDGFGLCSPGRWRPLQRGRLCSEAELEHARALQRVLRDFVVRELPDPRKAAFMLASGHLKVSPFDPGKLDSLRRKLAELLPDPVLALERPEGQPFWLHLLHQSLVLLGDPDAAILVDGDESFADVR